MTHACIVELVFCGANKHGSNPFKNRAHNLWCKLTAVVSCCNEGAWRVWFASPRTSLPWIYAAQRSSFWAAKAKGNNRELNWISKAAWLFPIFRFFFLSFFLFSSSSSFSLSLLFVLFCLLSPSLFFFLFFSRFKSFVPVCSSTATDATKHPKQSNFSCTYYFSSFYFMFLIAVHRFVSCLGYLSAVVSEFPPTPHPPDLLLFVWLLLTEYMCTKNTSKAGPVDTLLTRVVVFFFFSFLFSFFLFSCLQQYPLLPYLSQFIHVSVCLSVSSCKWCNKSYTCVCVFVSSCKWCNRSYTCVCVFVSSCKWCNKSYTCVCVFVCVQLQVMQQELYMCLCVCVCVCVCECVCDDYYHQRKKKYPQAFFSFINFIYFLEF